MQLYTPDESFLKEIDPDYFESKSQEKLMEAMDKAAKEKKSMGYSVKGRMKIGRNDPCPCRSGKKFKKCCIRKVKR